MKNGGEKVIILVYVDDMFLAADSIGKIRNITFRVVDLIEIKLVYNKAKSNGVVIQQDRPHGLVSISTPLPTDRILHLSGFMKCENSNVPVTHGAELTRPRNGTRRSTRHIYMCSKTYKRSIGMFAWHCESDPTRYCIFFALFWTYLWNNLKGNIRAQPKMCSATWRRRIFSVSHTNANWIMKIFVAIMNQTLLGRKLR